MPRRCITYVGPSMAPTFKPGDGLLLANDARVRPGDVVVFRAPGDAALVVHRVVSTGGGRIRTRGDNNTAVDPRVLHRRDIVGRVVGCLRDAERIPVAGALRGRLHAARCRLRLYAGRAATRLGSAAYHRLGRSVLLKRLVPDMAGLRIVTYTRPAGIELHLLLGRRLIGRLPPGQQRWDIRRPYRLFIDEAALQHTGPAACVK